MANTSDLVKRILTFRDNNGWPTSPISLVLNEAADALESAPTMRIEVTTDMISRALLGFDRGIGDPNNYQRRMEAALTAALNTQQGKNNG